MSAARAELARLVSAARGALSWHLEAGELDLPVPPGWQRPPLGRGAAFGRRPGAGRPPAQAAPSPPAAVVSPRPQAPAQPTPAQPAPAQLAAAQPAPAAVPSAALPAVGGSAAALHALRARIEDAADYPFRDGATEFVHGLGDPDARVLFVADAPGRLEDELGVPFVGEPGRLLGRMIHAMGLRRGRVYLTYIVKCAPRTQELDPASLAIARPHFDAELAAVSPDAIVALGEGAAFALGADAPLARVRGQWLTYGDRPVMPTFHPKALLQYPRTKREVWSDLKKVMRRLGLEGPAPRRG